MPSFVANENSPIYTSHNNGVVHLSDDHRFDKSLSQPAVGHHQRHDSARDTNESLSEFDNSSSHSSDTSDHRARMNGDHSSSMSPLPNGSQSSYGMTNGSSPSIEKHNPPSRNGFWNRSNGNTQPSPNDRAENAANGASSTLRGDHVHLPSQQHAIRNSGESSARGSLQQTPVDAMPSRSIPNGDRSPRASNDASQNLSPYPSNVTMQQRFSSPAASTSATSPSALQPPPAQLKHRHTLEVPKVTGRASKDGVDGAYASGRYSPTVPGAGGRRGSLNLGRKNTRSLHSEMVRDEVVPDDDALRWAEAYRQKRAKKKRKDDIDDEKVLVGTKVDENHANWTTAYNMLTGIRVSVSRTNAKLDRPLTDADFEAKQKSTFDIAGNELVPSAKYDFKFKDYAPWVFRHLRALFRLDPADYLMSLTGKYILSELGSPGKSGSFFYFSRDYKYIIKTIHHGEHKFLRRILKEYYNHVADNPNTLLSQFYGLHRVKMPYGKKIHFVVMNNLFPPHRDIHQTFDLKGSTVGRDYKEEELEKNPRATLKDLNWLRRKRHLELGLAKKRLFLEQLSRDVRLMQKLKIMDYSLLIGVHDLKKGNEENLRDKTLQVFNPGGREGPSDEMDPHQILMRTPSKLESARKARELRQMIHAERPVPMGQTSNRMPEELEEGNRPGGIFYSDDGGLRATHEDNTPGEEVYYLGVIDCLTHYGVIKKIEHFWKGLSSDRTQISALPPEEYGERFIKFMEGVTMSSEEAERDALDRERAIMIAEAEAEEAAMGAGLEPQTSPPAPSYLPPAPPGLRSPRSPEPNPTLEKASRKAFKKEKDVSKEQDVPERKITTANNMGSNAIGKGNSHTVLPVVEETAEAGSVSGRSREENVSGGGRPFTPSAMDTPSVTRPDGFTDLGPHGIGGRGPPTPPKSSYLNTSSGGGYGRKRSGSGASAASSIGSIPRGRLSKDSLDKALPPLPGRS
ncbi:Phosphatidylinositol 4-phosphate 5-kinase its3 [Apiospora saccharicola]|uniref:Phosphatidylinositol 4-phosphate 5-kinase its3 n=1 Tax=Apiospora saccharicola TaxID=335842 RepID=A0ABR1WGV9_9PEZI